jgi:imidazoleglycerol phosphate synthase glutamine amidotransferase subunit HisH
LAKEKTLADGISFIESKFDNIKVDLTPVAKEATLLAKVAELKEALNTIDFTAIEQAIQNVEDVTAKEATLIQGVGDIIKAVENIDFTDLENSIAEVKDAVANIDLSPIAKEDTLTQGISSVASKVEEVGNKIDNIKLPEIDTTNIASKDLERFFGVKPIEGYEFMTAEEVCAELEEIMTSMDLDLTPEKAKEITQQTLNN